VVGVVDPHDAELARLRARHRQASDRHVGPVRPVFLNHPRVIHFVNVVARQDQRVPGRRFLDCVHVLIDRVGRSLIPHLGDPLLRRDHLDILAQLPAEEPPPLIEVPVQARRLVLRQHQDLAQVGIDAVREREVDDPVNAPQRDRRLGPVSSQRLQARAPAPGQHNGQYVSIHQTASARCSVEEPEGPFYLVLGLCPIRLRPRTNDKGPSLLVKS